MRRLFFTAAVLITFAAAPVLAETPPAEIRIRVTSADLQSPEGVEQLYQRIVEAADQVCGAPTYFHGRANDSCREDSIVHAIETAELDELMEVHRRNQRPIFASR